MVQILVNLGERENRIVNLVKAKFGFKNKSLAINFIIKSHKI